MIRVTELTGKDDAGSNKGFRRFWQAAGGGQDSDDEDEADVKAFCRA